MTCRMLMFGVVGLLLAGGCEDSEAIRVMNVPEASNPAGTVTPATPADEPEARPAAHTAAPAGDMHWHMPDAWRQVDSDQPMRVATFRAGPDDGAPEVTVVRLAGDAGGTLANINRWRRQLGQPPAESLDALGVDAEAFTTDHVRGHLVRVDAGERRLAGAILAEPDGHETWFVKCTGDAAAVERVAPQVFAFAHSFHPATH